ncbi:hypothetical protein Rhopal_006949-T1 [Rhodotorula paludigena]|uniref:Mitochondrial carrier n=1 Tax=Rhodotorula paludigena TaxID=86838 RepID=A0AAV5GMT1_9BASI|nr:hypothetical protein Rhopal_006949-T1 [Rhodotorula paludigena]
MAAAPPSAERKPLPFVYQFAAGAIAGVTELLTLYPLGLCITASQVKTRMQLQVGKAVPGAEHYNGMVDCFRKIIAKEGVGRLYRGLVPPLMLEAPKRAVKFAANDFWGKTYKSAMGVDKMTQGLSVLTGCSAGATESIVVVPFELVKIRLQDKNSTYKGPMDVVAQIVRKEGLLGLYAGLEPTFWRHVTWNGGYFGCIFQVRALLPKAETKSAQLFNDFVSGAIGGFVGTAFNTPFDVVKSRVQNSVKASRTVIAQNTRSDGSLTHFPMQVAGQVSKYNWAFPSLLTIAREEGVGALYSGFLPKVLRLAPGGGVLLLVVEFTLGVFRQQLGAPYL